MAFPSYPLLFSYEGPGSMSRYLIRVNLSRERDDLSRAKSSFRIFEEVVFTHRRRVTQILGALSSLFVNMDFLALCKKHGGRCMGAEMARGVSVHRHRGPTLPLFQGPPL